VHLICARAYSSWGRFSLESVQVIGGDLQTLRRRDYGRIAFGRPRGTYFIGGEFLAFARRVQSRRRRRASETRNLKFPTAFRTIKATKL
jgi:hypothetical protein